MPFASRLPQPLMAPRLKMRGLSLIELMIAMVIGLVFMFAVLQVMSSNSRTRNDLELANRRMENGRYALQLLSNEIGMAGFYGEQGAATLRSPPPPDDDDPTTPCPTASNLSGNPLAELAWPIWGEEDFATGRQCGTLGQTDLDIASGNDYVVIRRASSCAVGTTFNDAACDPFVPGAPHIQIQSCRIENPAPGEFAGDPWIQTSQDQMLMQTRACDPDDLAPIYRFFVRLFYIAANHRDDDGIPTLKMAELGPSGYTVVPLAEGIEAMRIEYVDDAGVTRRAAAVTRWDRIRAVKLYLLARNTRPVSGSSREMTYRLGSNELEFDDNFRRQVLSTNIRLHNLSVGNN